MTEPNQPNYAVTDSSAAVRAERLRLVVQLAAGMLANGHYSHSEIVRDAPDLLMRLDAGIWQHELRKRDALIAEMEERGVLPKRAD